MLGKIFQKKKRESEKNTALNAMNLLVGILVRYPEIGTVRFDPASQCLQFSYTLEAGMLDVLPQSQINFQQDIMEGIKGYHLLNKIYSSVVEVEVERFARFANLTIKRDLKSFTVKEISFILSLLYQTIPGFFTIDALDRQEIDDLTVPEEMINVMLENIIKVSGQKEIVAFRDKEKVMFYNK